MRKLGIWLLVLMCLAGCAAEPDYETVADLPVEPVIAQAMEMVVDLPAQTVVGVMESGEGSTLYFAEHYTVCLQTLEAGDLNRTLEVCTGFSRDRLQLMQTKAGEWDRYEAGWSCVSDQGDQIGRICVLDDGKYHYALTLMTLASQAEHVQESWQALLRSFRLEMPGTQVNSGS